MSARARALSVATLFLVLLIVVTPIAGAVLYNLRWKVDKAIEDIEFAKDCHIWCIEIIENGTDQVFIDYVGDVDWHVRWIESYDNVLEILYWLRSLYDDKPSLE